MRERLGSIANSLPAGSWFVLDASAVVDIDSTATAMLEEALSLFEARHVRFGIAELHSEPLAILARSGVLERIGRAMVFDDLEDAYAAFEAAPQAGPAVTVQSGSELHRDYTMLARLAFPRLYAFVMCAGPLR